MFYHSEPYQTNSDQYTGMDASRFCQMAGEYLRQDPIMTVKFHWLLAASRMVAWLEGKSEDIQTEKVISPFALINQGERSGLDMKIARTKSP